MSAKEIDQCIRAFTPWPICQTSHNGTRIRVWQASISEKTSTAAAGSVIAVNDDNIEVACGDGVLQLKTLQRDGSKQLPINEFCNGYPLQVSDHLDGAST